MKIQPLDFEFLNAWIRYIKSNPDKKWSRLQNKIIHLKPISESYKFRIMLYLNGFTPWFPVEYKKEQRKKKSVKEANQLFSS